ncbi:MAG TPA: alkaline phosphatase [Bacteroidales bacterium]|nr:alkaline phosphatase [Bacteroidales bacterium]
MKKFIIFTIFTVILVSFTAEKKEKDKPLNLIIFIGDGMGVDHVYAAMTRSGFTMTFPAFPVTGFSITSSANSYITDSAAAATAMATGERTNNGMIASSPDGTELTTVMEMAKSKGMSAGVISTSQITHATPAGFIAHEGARSDYFDIAGDFLTGTADVFIGGGKVHFANRKDSADLTVDLKKKGYDVVYNMEDLRNSTSDKLAGLMADVAMPSIAAGRDTGFLAAATSKAIEVLSGNPNGFILMVEGSQIDWAGHDNNLEGIVNETLDMDRAVKVAYEFAKKSGNTLIVVTADHETGGLTLTVGNIQDKEVAGSFSTKGHTAVMVPVFAYGPGAGAFAGVQQNTELFDDFVNLLSLKKK